MSKQNLIIPCSCGYNCGSEMTIREDDENLKITVLSVKKKVKGLWEFVEFFSLDHDKALELVRWLISKYKLRDELVGTGNDQEKTSTNKPKKKVEEPVIIDEQLQPRLFLENDAKSTEEKSKVPEESVKRKRGRPRKNPT